MATEDRYPRTPMADLDLDGIRSHSVSDRPGKVSVDQAGSKPPAGSGMREWFRSLPRILAAGDLLAAARAIRAARSSGRGVLLGMGAHPLKVGLAPVIADALREGLFTGIATNGAAIVHDYEMALSGATSEEVDAVLGEGTFGMARETALDLNAAIAEASRSGEGLGHAVGRVIATGGLPHAGASVFAAAYSSGLPATVHVAMGTDIIHMHPSCDGAATGKASLDDFRLFASQVAALEGGVFINLGSAVIIPEVFLKACSLSHNLGHSLDGLTTVNMDFIQHYRPRVNVVARPTAGTGRGISLTGHHEIMFPLLLAAVREAP